MVIITLPSGTTITTNSPEEAARIIKALEQPSAGMFGGTVIATSVPACCTCGSYGTWMSVVPPPPCPVHGGGSATVTCQG